MPYLPSNRDISCSFTCVYMYMRCVHVHVCVHDYTCVLLYRAHKTDSFSCALACLYTNVPVHMYIHVLHAVSIHIYTLYVKQKLCMYNRADYLPLLIPRWCPFCVIVFTAHPCTITGCRPNVHCLMWSNAV